MVVSSVVPFPPTPSEEEEARPRGVPVLATRLLQSPRRRRRRPLVDGGSSSMTKARDDADDRSRSRAAENDLAPTPALAVDAEGRARRRTMGLPMIIIDNLTLQPQRLHFMTLDGVCDAMVFNAWRAASCIRRAARGSTAISSECRRDARCTCGGGKRIGGSFSLLSETAEFFTWE